MIDSFGALLMPIRDDPNGPAVTRNPMTYFHRVIASTSTCKGSGAYFRCGFWEHDVENFGKNCTNNQPHFHGEDDSPWDGMGENFHVDIHSLCSLCRV
jgi:hypothetical protein